MQGLRDFAKKALPDPVVEWIRRRRALRLYLKELGHEIYYSKTSLDNNELEGRIAARREGAYGQMLKDVLERTDLIFQELDRRMEGLNARYGNELRSLRAEVEELRSRLEEIRAQVEDVALPGPPQDAAAAVGGAGD